MTLRKKLLVMYSLTGLIVLLVMGAWTYYEFRKIKILDIGGNVQKQLELFDFALTSFVNEAENDIQALSENDLIRSSEGNQFTNFLNADDATFEYNIGVLEQSIINVLNAYRTSRTYVNSVYIGYENGDFVRSHPRSAPTQYDPRSRPWYTLAKENPGKIMMTEPYSSLTAPDVNIGIVKALFNQNNEMFAVIGADITLVNLTNYISDFKIGYDGQPMILDPNGVILASKNPDHLFQNISTILPEKTALLLTQEQGTFSYGEYYYFFYTSPKLGWKIIAVIPVSVVNREVQKSALNPPLISLLITILLFGILSIYGLDIFISKPLIELSRVPQQNALTKEQYQLAQVRSKDEIGQLSSVYNRMITARMEIENDLKQERDLAQALTQSIAVMIKTLDFDTVLDFILEQVSQVVPNDSANIMLLEKGKAYICRSRGYEKFGLQDAMSKASLNIEDVFTLRQMLEKKKPIIVRDTAKYKNWKTLEGQDFLHSYAGSPIIVRDQVIGFLNVDSAEPGFFTPVHLETLKTFADYAAIAIDNARMHQKIQRHAADLVEQINLATREIQRKANELETLYKVGKEITSTLDLKATLQIITDAARNITDADRCILFLADEGSDDFRNIVGSGFTQEELQEFSYEEFSQSVNGWVFREKKPVLSRNVLKDERHSGLALSHSKRMQDQSIAAAPLKIADTMIGTLSVINGKGKRTFQSGDLNRIMMLADQASIAIQNASLYEKAQEADRLKSAFLASMSHELRTPLNSIIGFTGILLQGLVGSLNDEQTKQLHMVQNSANHLLNLINDILDISKIEAGQLVISSDAFNLKDSIEKAIQTITPLAEMKALTVTADIQPEVGIIVSDQRRVEQILLNLLNNAVKFTNEGEVRLECTIKKKKIVISIIDTGIGIKENDQERLFKPFQQIDSGLSRKYEGTGLGLSICKRLVEKLGGKIWLKSRWGKGSTFTFTLPLKTPGVMQ
jgi:signal transduction histidine kinase